MRRLSRPQRFTRFVLCTSVAVGSANLERSSFPWEVRAAGNLCIPRRLRASHTAPMHEHASKQPGSRKGSRQGRLISAFRQVRRNEVSVQRSVGTLTCLVSLFQLLSQRGLSSEVGWHGGMCRSELLIRVATRSQIGGRLAREPVSLQVGYIGRNEVSDRRSVGTARKQIVSTALRSQRGHEAEVGWHWSFIATRSDGTFATRSRSRGR